MAKRPRRRTVVPAAGSSLHALADVQKWLQVACGDCTTAAGNTGCAGACLYAQAGGEDASVGYAVGVVVAACDHEGAAGFLAVGGGGGGGGGAAAADQSHCSAADICLQG